MLEKKGLCSTCKNDKKCIFLREVPVVQCEEFDDSAEKQEKEKEPGENRIKHHSSDKK